jgi:hypothetical protein
MKMPDAPLPPIGPARGFGPEGPEPEIVLAFDVADGA